MSEFMVNFPRQIASLANANSISVWLVVSIMLAFYVLIYVLLKKVNVIDAIRRLSKYRLKTSVYAAAFMSVFLFFVSFSYARTDPGNWVYEPFFSAITENNSEFVQIKNKTEVLLDINERERINPLLKGIEPTQNVVLIIVDALRSDRMSLYGYERPTTPYLEQRSLHQGFQKVEQFTSTCSESVCGIYSVLSSRNYERIAVGLLDITELLSMVGYEIYFILSSNHSYNSLTKLYGNHLDVYHDGRHYRQSMPMNDDQGVVDRLKTVPDFSGQPSFFYFHLMSAHLLGKNKEPFLHYLPQAEHSAGLISKHIKDGESEYAIKFSNGYDNGLVQTDYYIEQVLSILEEKNYLEDSIVIITGDHGDGLGEHGFFSHTYTLFQEEINIPLLWISETCQLVNTRYGTHIDIAPTVIDCLGMPKPETWQGISLLDPYKPNRLTYHQTLRNKKVILVIEESNEHMYKLMADVETGKAINWRLYDVYNDPQETRDITNEVAKEKLNYLKQHLIEYFDLADKHR